MEFLLVTFSLWITKYLLPVTVRLRRGFDNGCSFKKRHFYFICVCLQPGVPLIVDVAETATEKWQSPNGIFLPLVSERHIPFGELLSEPITPARREGRES